MQCVTNSLNGTKQAVEVKKRANKILGVLQRNPYRLIALLQRNGRICPWSALCASTAPSPGVHISKRTLSVLNLFSVARRALFVTITVVPVALIQCYRTWVGKILRHVGIEDNDRKCADIFLKRATRGALSLLDPR